MARLAWAQGERELAQLPTLAAALVAERLGLPVVTPEAVVAAQHKLHARRVLQEVAPEANLVFAELDVRYGDPIPEGLFQAVANVLAYVFRVQGRTQAASKEQPVPAGA